MAGDGEEVADADWLHDKTVARTRNGMVAARHPLSAAAGREILIQGGNAMDATAAASLAGSVVQPMANTIGGGGLVIVAHPERGRSAMNYLYQAPAAATAAMFPLGENAAPGLFGWSGIKDQLNEIGGLAVGIPGSIAGLHAAHREFGALPWSKVMAPAIRLARDGFPMDWYGSLMLAVHADQMQAFPNTARQFLRDGQYTYRPDVIGKADVHRQPALAATLEKIATEGPDAFYRGDCARSIVAAVRQATGILSAEDLGDYRVRRYQPASVAYRGHTIEYVPYGSPTLALLMNILAQFDLAALDAAAPRRLHIVAEALKRSFAYRDRFNGDTDRVDGPWSGLASAAFGKAIAATIDIERTTPATTEVDPGRFAGETYAQPAGRPGGHEGTVHISAADRGGCLVALTETVVGNFGSLVSSDNGVLLNNGMIGFSPIPGEMNCVAPGKRPATNMCPVIVSDASGRPVATLGASGGRKIIPAVGQILAHFIDQQLPMQQAVSQPRLDLEGPRLTADSRLPRQTIEALTAMGHTVDVRTEGLSTFEFGNPCGIAVSDDGWLQSGVNPFQATTAAGC